MPLSKEEVASQFKAAWSSQPINIMAMIQLVDTESLSGFRKKKMLLNPAFEAFEKGAIDAEQLHVLLMATISDSVKQYDLIISGSLPIFLKFFQEKIRLGIISEDFLFEFINQHYLDNDRELIEKIIKSPVAHEGTSLLEASLLVACKNKDMPLLDHIESEFPDIFEILVRSKNKESEVLDIKACINPELASKHMRIFSNGLACVAPNDALLVLSKIKERKTYKFTPVLIDGGDEWHAFLTFVNEHKDNLKGQQINVLFSGKHWVTGAIFIDALGKTDFLLIDSLGVDESGSIYDEYKLFNQYITLLESGSDTPGDSAYFSSETMQNDTIGCSIFAIDTLRHLFTIDNYLPSVAADKFPLLEDVKRRLNKRVTLEKGHAIKLPLQLMRTAQTSRHIIDIEKKQGLDLKGGGVSASVLDDTAEPFWKVNHGKETIYSSFSRDFIENAETGKRVNRRLERKFEKMGAEVWSYLKSTEQAEVEQSMHDFTVEGFCQKVCELEGLPLKAKTDFIEKKLTNTGVIKERYREVLHDSKQTEEKETSEDSVGFPKKNL